MIIYAGVISGKLLIGDSVFNICNKIKSVNDGTRKSFEVVRSIPDGKPFDPKPFPKGNWNVTGLHWQQDKHFDPRTYGPVKIMTDAWQWVNIWELDEYGDYSFDTADRVRDEGYSLYYSAYSTTIRGIHLASKENALLIAKLIQGALMLGEKVAIEVN